MTLEERITTLATTMATEINTLRTQLASARGGFIGATMVIPGTGIPDGWLLMDGTPILWDTYTDLGNAIWCGTPSNATADWGYRTDSDVSPASNRSNTGTYIVLPNWLDRYVRGGPSGTLDYWTYYDDEVKAHAHTFSITTNTNTSTGGGGTRVTAVAAGTNRTTANFGGTENRPLTVLAIPLIYSGVHS
jgi:hypothetical protein